MKVGDYVRIKPEQNERCGIDKLIRIENQGNYNDYYFEKFRGIISNPEHFIAKSSPNIIDLIEIGDYVNGIKIDEIGDNYVCRNSSYGDDDDLIFKSEIETIVTKEQFERMEYKI